MLPLNQPWYVAAAPPSARRVRVVACGGPLRPTRSSMSEVGVASAPLPSIRKLRPGEYPPDRLAIRVKRRQVAF